MLKEINDKGGCVNKVKYPVMFGNGDNAYPGMMAMEDIGPGEIVVRIPSKMIISTKVAYDCVEL